jgi:hypothetical protein
MEITKITKDKRKEMIESKETGEMEGSNKANMPREKISCLFVFL